MVKNIPVNHSGEWLFTNSGWLIIVVPGDYSHSGPTSSTSIVVVDKSG